MPYYQQLPAIMDCFLEVQNAAAMLFFPLLILFCLWKRRGIRGKAMSEKTVMREAPEPPGCLPVIGHLHLLWGPKPPAQILGDMADKLHGPVFMLRLGMRRRMLVIANWQAAKECLLTNDKVLASRPRCAATKHLGYNYSVFGLAPYGDYWRTMRRISTVEFFSSAARVESQLKHARSTEIDECVRELHGLWAKNQRRPARLEMVHWLRGITNNTVNRALTGKRYFGSGGSSDEGLRFQKALGGFFQSLIGAFVPLVSDAFPLPGWMDWQGREAVMKSAAGEMDAVMTGLVEEHRQRRLAGKADEDPDFMDKMLDIVEDGKFSDLDHDIIVKATCLAIILGAADTFSVGLARALALIVLHQQVFKNVREELDAHIGKDRRVDESDLDKLVYLQAVIKESFRLHPPGPLLLPREALSDCQIGGFHVPAGTHVVVHVLKLQRDPSVWDDDVEEFKPERFLPPSRHAGVDVRGHHFQLVPFGSGRRICPGMALALQVVHLTIARLIQAFEIETPAGSPEEVRKSFDLLFDTPDAPLELMITPRLHDTFYV